MNKVMLIGNVDREPEVRYVDSDVAVARLTLVTTERGYVLQNGTEVPERTDRHNVLLWRNIAKFVEKHVHKGDKLYVEGRIRYATYNNKSGMKYNTMEIWAENIELLSSTSRDSLSGTESGNASTLSHEI